jgi:hypothetical protein
MLVIVPAISPACTERRSADTIQTLSITSAEMAQCVAPGADTGAAQQDATSPVPTSKQAALGAVVGAYVGDAAGVTLEFTKIKDDAQVRTGVLRGCSSRPQIYLLLWADPLPLYLQVRHAMTMPGGGAHSRSWVTRRRP